MSIRFPFPVLAAIASLLLAGCVDPVVSPDDSAPTTPPPGSGSTPPPAPTGKVTLNWARPVTNEDGTTLTDLAGYRVYYGPAPYPLSTSVDVRGGNVTSVEIEGLDQGAWYFAIASYNAAGVESSKSGVVTTTI